MVHTSDRSAYRARFLREQHEQHSECVHHQRVPDRNHYDHHDLEKPEGTKPLYKLTYKDCRDIISRLETEYKTYEKWDSLMMLTLVMEIEAEYGVSIPMEKLGSVKTLADLYEFVKK